MYLVSLSYLTKHILSRNLEVIEVEGASRRSPDTKLLFLLRDLNAHILCSNEASDSLVALARVNVREDEENLRLVRIGDPHFGTVDDPMVTLEFSTGLHCECI